MTMKTLICIEPGKLVYGEVPRPALKANHAIIKVKRIGVCGTDLHAFEGTQPYFTYPRILGHELSGEIADVDGPGNDKARNATFIPYFNCGSCAACKAGKTNCCVNLKVCGVHVDGGMAEYISVPTSSLLYNDSLSLEELALIEPLAIGAHGVRRAGIIPGEFVLVVGAGPIGLGTMALASIAEAKVIALDVAEHRLRFCKEKLNIPHVINAASGDALKEISEITKGSMPSVVIDATGNQKAINQAFHYMAHGGRYILIGLQKGDITFSHPEFHKREGTLMSSRNATREDFTYVMSCLNDKKINAAHYITHRANFDQAAGEFGHWLNPANGVIKAMIEL